VFVALGAGFLLFVFSAFLPSFCSPKSLNKDQRRGAFTGWALPFFSVRPGRHLFFVDLFFSHHDPMFVALFWGSFSAAFTPSLVLF